jgi:hypothetical protein
MGRRSLIQPKTGWKADEARLTAKTMAAAAV